MSVQITTGFYLSGMPTFEYSMIVNDVAILLRKEDFDAMVQQLSSKISEDYQKAIEVAYKYDQKVAKMQEFKTDILPIFYDGDIGGDFFFKREPKEIDDKKLTEILEKYETFFGF
jgi:hypothetical protein